MSETAADLVGILLFVISGVCLSVVSLRNMESLIHPFKHINEKASVKDIKLLKVAAFFFIVGVVYVIVAVCF